MQTIAGHETTVRYDRLVVAVGSISKTLPIPGLKEHALGFKTLADGIALRQRVLRQLEIAETLDDETERASYLTFVFVGSRYAGVEGLAELQDLALDVLDEYPRCRKQGTRWLLIEAADRIMGEVHRRLGDYTAAELDRRADRRPHRHHGRGGAGRGGPAVRWRGGADPDAGLDRGCASAAGGRGAGPPARGRTHRGRPVLPGRGPRACGHR